MALHGNGPGSRMARFEASTLPELIRHTGPLDGKRVLDFGCGSGTITPSLALRAKEVVAFDVNADAVAITRARLREHGLGARRRPPRRLVPRGRATSSAPSTSSWPTPSSSTCRSRCLVCAPT